MRRRTFVLQAPFLLTCPAIIAACGKDNATSPINKSVLVVGGGIAGLAAAKKLKAQGFTVTLLEAKDSIGGRIRTYQGLGFPFEEGAGWIHGPRNNPIAHLAEDAGATTLEVDARNFPVYDVGGLPYDASTLDKSYKDYDATLETVRKSGSLNESFADRFTALYPQKSKDRLWNFMLSAYLEADTGGDIEYLSSLYFADNENFRGADVLITNGYDKITNFLANGLEIHLNEPVESIDYSHSKVTVRSTLHTYEVDYVVVAVPLGVLKHGGIAFSPSLPLDRLEAIRMGQMGHVNKFLLLWEKPFWDEKVQCLGFTPETKGKFNYFLNLKKINGANALMTFAFGDYALQTEQMPDQAIVQEIMAHLRAIYGMNLPHPIALRRTQWGSDVYTGGAYTFVANGTSSSNFDSLAKSLENKVFFAGEHTHRAYRGTTHGAYLSGLREADKIGALQ